jgi:hypothetical protein
VSAAPTPLRVNAQRLVTQMLDDEIATPNILLSGQHAAIENVIYRMLFNRE